MSDVKERKVEPKESVVKFKNGAELFAFLNGNTKHLQLSLEETNAAMKYLQEQGYVIGHKGQEIVRFDLFPEEKFEWAPYSVDDLINDACDIHYNMLQQALADMEKAGIDNVSKELEERLEILRKDDEILDQAFERTVHGIELEKIAQKIAQQCIEVVASATKDEDIEKEIAGKIHLGDITSLHELSRENKEGVR